METDATSLETTQQHPAVVEGSTDTVAIIGMGCRFPGEAENPDRYWQMLVEGQDAVSEIPQERWDISRFYDPNPDKPGKTYVKEAAFVRQPISDFDALFFGISPREAQVIDPQQRLLLEVSWEAFEDAGIVPEKLIGSNTGVYIGAFTTDHMVTQLGILNRDLIANHTVTSMTMTLLSNRLSYYYDLHGPSVTMDTACSSSLVSIHQACRALLNKECDMAVAGGVNVMSRPELLIAMSKGQLLAKDGRCKTFDASADGYGRGEGAGILVLKTLSAALEDGDRIHAIIRGTGVNQDGRTDGITLPNPKAQENLIRQVLQQARVNPEEVSYIEAHGTGTAAGDPRETGSLGSVIGNQRAKGEECLIGSVKANIGHLEAASGVAGVIKAALCLKHELVPPQISFKTPNPSIPFDSLGLKVPEKLEPLPKRENPHIAIVNSFGYGGTNAHLVLEQWESDQITDSASESEVKPSTQMLLLSAPNTQALTQVAKQYISLLGSARAASLEDICYSSFFHRSHFTYRLFLVAETKEGMLDQLEQYVAGESNDATQLLKIDSSESTATGPVFVFTGMGPQWWGMGRELLEEDAEFRLMAERVDQIFRDLSGWSILNEVLQEPDVSRMANTSVAQPANFLIQACLTDWWRRHGVSPAAIVGHSVGEVSAAWACGALTLEQAVAVSYHRSRLQEQCAGSGGMLAIGLTRTEAEAVIKSHAFGKVSIAAINSQNNITLAGETPALERIAKKLESDGVFNRFLTVEVPYHSPIMDIILDDVKTALADLSPGKPDIPVYSTVQGGIATGSAFDAQYWCDNVRNPVFFSDAINALIGDGYNLFLEVGPHPVLGSSVKQCLKIQNAEGFLVSSLNRRQSDIDTLLLGIGNLWSKGCTEIPECIFSDTARFVDLPTYPWQRIRHWLEGAEATEDRTGVRINGLLGRRLNQPSPEWELFVNDQAIKYLQEHHVEDALVLPGASYIEAGLAIDREINASDCVTLTDVHFDRALVVDADDEPKLRMKYDAENRMFSVFSKSSLEGSKWVKHASGYISSIKEQHQYRIPLGEIRKRCTETVEAVELYTKLEERGLHYGPTFQGISCSWRGENEVLSEIDCEKSSPAGLDYRLSPPVLDACFQSLILTMSGRSETDVYIPVSIGTVNYYHTPHGTTLCHGILRSSGDDYIVGDLSLCDENGLILVEVCDVRCQLISTRDTAMRRMEQWSYLPEWQLCELDESMSYTPARLLVFTNGPVGEEVANTLERQGADIVRVTSGPEFTKHSNTLFQIRPGDAGDLGRLLGQDIVASCSKTLFLSYLDKEFSVEDPVDTHASLELLHTLQSLTSAITNNPMRLYFVTQHAQQVTFESPNINLAHAQLIGMVRVAANEYPDNQCTLIDLDDHSLEHSCRQLLDELTSDSKELEVAYSEGMRFIYRLNRVDVSELEKRYLGVIPERTGAYEPYRLELRERGNPETLQLRRVDRLNPESRDVELQVNAISVPDNLSADLLAALPTHGESHGADSQYVMTVSATVLSCGDRVEQFSPGDNILAIVPSLPATHITLSEDLIFPKPGLMSMPDTRDSGQFLPTLTAFYGLVELAGLKSDDRILIHNADSSDGLAAVCMAKHIGATIYATADRKDTISFLKNLGVDIILPAKSRKFARDIKAIAGEVDLVFNAPDKEVEFESAKLLAVSGRVVNTIGTSDQSIFHPKTTDNKCLSYYYVNIPLLLRARPATLYSAAHEVNKLLSNSNFPRPPVHVLSIHQLPELFVAQNTKSALGERVLMLETPSHIMPQLDDYSRFDPEAAYLITGGFGGFGGALAKWMIARGARHLVLVGRRGKQSPGAQGLVSELSASGAKIEPVAADLSKREDVVRMFTDMKEKQITIRGVMHAAGVLDDGVIPEITDDKYQRVVSPKSLAAWYLHEQTQDLDLHFMVYFSSITTLIGNPGQVNYVAANTWLDMFAHYRRSQGLPATSVNWGLIAEVGFGVRNQDIVKHFDRLGVNGLPPEDALDCLAYIMRWDCTQYGIADMAWERLFGIHNPRFDLLRNVGTDSAEANLHQELSQLDNGERQIRVTEMFCDYVASTLELLPEQVDSEQRLNALGLDSLVAVELQVLIQTGFGVEMPMLELMKDQSIGQMSNNVLRKMGLSA